MMISNDRTLVLHCCKESVCACSVARLCLTLCDPMGYSPPGSSVHAISQPRILERVAISYSRGSSWPRGQTSVSCASSTGRQILCHCTTQARGMLFETACIAITVSMGFDWKEHSGIEDAGKHLAVWMAQDSCPYLELASLLQGTGGLSNSLVNIRRIGLNTISVSTSPLPCLPPIPPYLWEVLDTVPLKCKFCFILSPNFIN